MRELRSLTPRPKSRCHAVPRLSASLTKADAALLIEDLQHRTGRVQPKHEQFIRDILKRGKVLYEANRTPRQNSSYRSYQHLARLGSGL